ncbi:copper chaperone PCu(A)C [Luteimonas sp. MC1750]|uniref:copper chaperone PCu(A)C n=1 Tax=Luteimonas sp. MC1750 TaxID=2799326 RepID=UPI0018F078FB|nr:copper chaperone PCu(A)C [Luteimonas sp. MC1750]MBJ6983922.1 copper chaperone PCu(A)C [Luteimonas sp. MC1750]QQO06740.1 copper chaperone PCu(A)C [Luteimonas sp. MC1750]
MHTSLRLLPHALLSLALTLVAAPPVRSAEPAPPTDGAACTPRIAEGWLRAPPMPMPMMAGFARVQNPCPGTVVVTGARSAAFASVELHETRVVDGVSRMRAVQRMPVQAGDETVLRPGGLHLMLMRPVAPLAEGDVARVEFLLSDGRRIGADFVVRAPGAR